MTNKEYRFDSNFIHLHEYNQMVQSNIFGLLRKSSDEFLKLNSRFLTEYFGKWVRDPLNNWSRKWEYPFVFSQLANVLDNSEITENDEESGQIKILDAGSGITFFPYFLKSYFRNTDITAIDYDKSYIPVFEEINKQVESPIEFIHGSLDSLPFPDNSFNIIYCISTLEHTGNFQKIISEFRRVLKPKGILILTIDICEHNDADIPIVKANALHRTITQNFIAQISKSENPIPSDLFNQDILTTKYAYRHFPGSLWDFNFNSKLRYFMSHLIKRGKIRLFPDNITVFCEVYLSKS